MKISLGKPEEEEHLRSRHNLESSINIHIKRLECEDMGLIQLAQEREQWVAVVNTVMNLQFLYKIGTVPSTLVQDWYCHNW